MFKKLLLAILVVSIVLVPTNNVGASATSQLAYQKNQVGIKSNYMAIQGVACLLENGQTALITYYSGGEYLESSPQVCGYKNEKGDWVWIDVRWGKTVSKSISIERGDDGSISLVTERNLPVKGTVTFSEKESGVSINRYPMVADQFKSWADQFSKAEKNGEIYYPSMGKNAIFFKTIIEENTRRHK